MGNKAHTNASNPAIPLYTNLQQSDMKPETDIKKDASLNAREVLYLQNLKKAKKDELNLNFQDLKHTIQEGTTIFSASSGVKYMVECTKFSKEQDYVKYTDTLIYRLQALRSCPKIKKQVNKIIGIYGQKIFTCSSCNPCTSYKVLVIQKYYPDTLQDMFQDTSKLSYCDIYNLLHSFSKVMSAYQYKRLRFGPIDFSKIFITSAPTSHANPNQPQLHPCQKPTNPCPERTLICKIGDPYIRSFLQLQSIQKSSMNKTDVYKNDVLKIGQILEEVLKEKQIREVMGEDSLSGDQVRVKDVLEKLVKDSMICQINSRFNWLQIQRFFQQSNTNQKSTRPVSMLQSINTQVINSYQESGNKPRSIEKPVSRPPIIYHVSDPMRSYSGRKQVLQNASLNKQNTMDHNNFITLKPYKKSQSKHNIIVQAQPQPQPRVVSVQKPYRPQEITTTMNTITQNSHVGSLPPTNLNSQAQNIFLQSSQNSGYGVVENNHPEYHIGLKIKYNNLHNIGKYWSKFQGNFVDGSKEGPGTIYLTNGHIFTGYFEKDLANGKGSVYINGQLVLKGTWKNNILTTQY